MPPLLTDAEIEEVLTILPDLTKWADGILAYATDAAVNHGKEWNGFKVVEGRSVRKYKDEELVAQAAKDHGYTDIYRQSLITMTEMQKLMDSAHMSRDAAAVLAAVNLADQLTKAQEGAENLRRQVKTYLDEASRAKSEAAELRRKLQNAQNQNNRR